LETNLLRAVFLAVLLLNIVRKLSILKRRRLNERRRGSGGSGNFLCSFRSEMLDFIQIIGGIMKINDIYT
jgi:hypothetical protein